MLASGLTHDSAHFLNELLSWLTNSCQELSSDTSTPPEVAWEMLVECEAKIFEDVNDVRAQCVDSAKFNAGRCIWGQLKAWEAQARHLLNNFHDDLALTGIFTRQTLLHGQGTLLKSKIQSLTEQVSKVDSTVKTQAGEIKGKCQEGEGSRERAQAMQGLPPLTRQDCPGYLCSFKDNYRRLVPEPWQGHPVMRWGPTMSNASPFGWPPAEKGPWVQAQSACFKDQMVECPLSEKERAQFLGLHEDWAGWLVEDMWEWSGRAAPPLRLMAELILSALALFQTNFEARASCSL